MVFSENSYVVILVMVLSGSHCSGEVISTSLYCGFENSFYKTGETWSDQCYNYNCSSDGVFAQLSQECPPPAEREPTEQCTPAVEPTDRQSCCTDELFCDQLPPHGTDPKDSRPPIIYTCPDDWTDVARFGICIKKFEEAKVYEEAKQACREKGAFLINLENNKFISMLLRDFLPLFPADEGIFWTGAHYDGRTFLLDQITPATPSLVVIDCSEPSIIPGYFKWACGYEDAWAKLDGRPCIGAKVTPYNDDSNSTQFVLTSCLEKHEYVCARDYKGRNSLELIPSKLCDQGWEWNPLTRICIKYVKSSEAMPNYLAAAEHCGNEGGSLYIANSTEKEFLLYEIMKSRKPKPYSVWVGEECQEVINPYIFGTPNLTSIKRPAECYESKPYICEKAAKPSDRSMFEATLEMESVDLVCKLDGQSNTEFRIRDPQGQMRSEVALGGISAYTQAGPYQCIVWSEELSAHVYSNVFNFDGRGSTHPSVITIPLSSVTFKGWHNMVSYYQFERREFPPTIYSVRTEFKNAAEKALELSLGIIQNPDRCPSCINRFVNENTKLELLAINHISDWEGKGAVVAGLVVFHVERIRPARQATPLESDGSADDWAILDKYMKQSLIGELGLDPNEEQLVEVFQSGRCPGEERYIAELGVNVSLPSSPLYETVRLSLCGYTGDPIVSATCASVNGGGGQWKVTVIPCGDDEDVTETTKMLRSLSLTKIEQDNVVQVLNVTSNAITNELSAADITYVAEILNNVEGVSLRNDQTEPFFESFTESINRLLDVGDEAINEAQAKANTSTRILQAIDILATIAIIPTILPTAGINIFETVKDNFAYRLTTQPEIYGVMLTENTLNERTVEYPNVSQGVLAINNDKQVGLFLRKEGLDKTRKAFTVYGKKKFHRSPEVLKSVDHIVSATVTKSDGKSIDLDNKFKNLVSLHFPQTLSNLGKQSESSGLQCGFWELEDGVWSADGCVITIDENGVTCSCDHLTDFSVLLDIRRGGSSDPIDSIHREILTIISYVGLSISIAALGLVVLTAVMYSRFRKTNSQKVLALLAASLLGRDITFVVGIERTETYGGCVAVAVFLHYFVLTSFAWMLVEGILQYLRFVKVIGTYIPRFMLKASIPSFGIPIIIIIITLAIDVDLYKASDEYCWMKMDAIYYAVLLPVGLVLLANVIVYVMVVRSLILSGRRMKSHKTNQSSSKTQTLHLIACISIFIVLGITWIFGYFALIEGSGSIAFQYLFCIFNSLQGLLIFVFHNVRDPAIRKAWRDLCCCTNQSQSTGTTGADNYKVNKDRQPMHHGPAPIMDNSSF